LLKLTGICVAYGERVVLKDVEFLVRPGDRIGLVGPNGAGKTTLFRVIAGEERPDEGSVSMDPGTVVGYFSQETGEMSGRSALEEVMAGAGRVFEIGLELAELEHRMSDPGSGSLGEAEMERYGELQTQYLQRDGYGLESRAEAVLTGLGIGPDRFREPVERFSGGWKMRIALARILVLEPDLLLMDEPTNHLDVESIVWLEEWLKAFKGDLVMTSHDREFMTRLCSRTAELASGALSMYSGNYDFYLRERDIRRDQLVATYNRQQAMFAKDEEFIERFAARASHASLVQSRIKALEKIDRVVLPPDPKAMSVQFADCPRSGDQVVVLKGLSKSWPSSSGAHEVFSGASGMVKRGDRVALTGINGAGKSTLLKIIAGHAEASSGLATLGGGVRMGYFSQYSSDSLEPGRTVFEEVSERLPKASIGEVKSVLGAFLFSGDDADKRVSVLSGGEKSRVMLACMLAVPVNFLVLDEPTNHLDIRSREILLDALLLFDGAIMIVSHDRFFLRHLANRVFELDRGELKAYEGDYGYYLEKSGREAW
jgi:ATP-binding cassette, subfamily F, member 3